MKVPILETATNLYTADLFEETSSKVKMGLLLTLITASVLVFTEFFEVMMDTWFPDEALKGPHLATMLFSSCIAPIAAYSMLRLYNSMLSSVRTALHFKKKTQAVFESTVVELQNLQAITNELLELEDPTRTIDTVARGIVEHLGFETALVCRCDVDTGEIVGMAAFPSTDTSREFASGFQTSGKGRSRMAETMAGGRVIKCHPENLFLSLASELDIPISKQDWNFPASIGIALRVKDRKAGFILAGGSEKQVLGGANCMVRVSKPAAIAMENARLFSCVRKQKEDLTEMRHRLVEAEENERRRIAGDLHDQVGQNLTALSINLNIVSAGFSDSPGSGAPFVSESIALLDDTMAQIRGVIANLLPPGLEEAGLPGAMPWFVNRFSKRTGIEVRLNIDKIAPRPSPIIEKTLFRIAQEAFTNIARHSAAQKASLALKKSGGKVLMQISDDGCGFQDARTAPGSKPNWGLRLMRERAETVGGTLRVESKPGAGTRIRVEIYDGNKADDRFSCR